MVRDFLFLDYSTHAITVLAPSLAFQRLAPLLTDTKAVDTIVFDFTLTET